MKFYFSPGACSMATHISLLELGLSFEAIKLDKENKQPEFLKMNPKGYIPMIVTDKGEPLTEGAVILQYLADQKPEKNYLPKWGTWERYKAMEMLNFIATEVHRGMSPLWGADRWVTQPEGNAQLRKAVATDLGKKLTYLENQLKGKQFLFGDTFTACDAYAFTVLSWSRMLKLDMAPYPTLLGYVEKIQSRPTVQTAMKAEGLTK